MFENYLIWIQVGPYDIRLPVPDFRTCWTFDSGAVAQEILTSVSVAKDMGTPGYPRRFN